MNGTKCLAFALVLALVGCAQSSTPGTSGTSPQNFTPVSSAREPSQNSALVQIRGSSSGPSGKIQHVVIIFQENRTTNDLFNAFPGADTVRSAKNSLGQTVTLQPEPLTAPYDISHLHTAFKTEYANGQMNGFNLVSSSCEVHATCPAKDVRAYGYVPRAEVEPYYVMASRYTFANRMFQTNEGPSFPAHQYILSGTSTISDGSPLRAAENPLTPAQKNTGGCDSPTGSLVLLIDPEGRENQKTFPCFDRNSLVQLVEAKSLTWHYYQAHLGPGLWEGPDAIKPVWESQEFSANVVAPPSQVLTDIKSGNLADVVWVTPTAAESDHAKSNNGSGPAWVASVVNAIGESKYWDSTAIFVTWDDWGGWYDQVKPPKYNSYELSFRVPLLVISPFARVHYISAKQHEFGSILKFTEETFGLGSLGTTDVRADDLADCFNFNRPPSKFTPIPTSLPASYFLRQPISMENPDDDF